jgi:hypothetical protein
MGNDAAENEDENRAALLLTESRDAFSTKLAIVLAATSALPD